MASLITNSQTASASVLVASLVYLLARFWPRSTGATMAIGGALLIITLPCLTLLLRHYDPQISFDWREASLGARVEIWYAVADAAMRAPMIGHGMEAARFMSDWGMAHLYYPFDKILHPHNGVLQIWLEFGLIGAVIAAIVWLATVRRIGRMPERELGATLALLGTIALVSTISHGLWQSWWLGAVGLCPAMIRMLREV
jgi:O-antigen ligase